MKIEYKWRYDVKYYAAVVDRYYRRLPLLLHLPTHFTLLWLLGIILYAWATGETPKEFAGWAVPIGDIGIPAGVVLTKLGIRLKYRLRRRSGFGSETGSKIHVILRGNAS